MKELLSAPAIYNNNDFDTICANLIPSKNKPFILAIDGNCGSGKTTLAATLTSRYDSTIISMDDFFLPFSLRTHKRLEEAGGNIHYERFLSEIAEPLSFNRSKAFDYYKFDCSTGTYTQKIHAVPASLIIIEGSYSMHPKFQSLYDYSVFVTCSWETQIKRIEKRSGKEKLQMFKDYWIPLENRYFSAFNIKKSCSLILETG